MSPRNKQTGRDGSAAKHDFINRFTWEITAINTYLEKIHQFSAKALGVSSPQWKILMAIAHLDPENGVPGNVVSKMLHVDPSFVTTQSKILERAGLLRRKSSSTDGRVVHLLLTAKTARYLSALSQQHDATNEFFLGQLGENTLLEFTGKLAAIKNLLDKVRLKIAADF